MLFRRIAQHVRTQNWTAIFIDFAIVVIGVFIGIQVSNWNQQQSKIVKQDELLVQLVEDLHADLDKLESSAWYSTMRFNAAESLVNRVNGWELPDTYPEDYETFSPLALPQRKHPQNATAALYFSQRYSGFSAELRTYSQLIATGDMSFIGRPKLASLLREHYNYSEQWSYTEKSRHRNTNNDLLAAFNRHGLSISDKTDWETLDSIVKADLELQGLLKRTAWHSSVQLYYLNLITSRTKTLISQIESTSP